MTMLVTTDLCDAHEDKLADGSLRVFPPVFKSFGKRGAFHGPAYTLKVHEDNALIRATLETAGDGQVLVVDGGGSQRCALVGGQLALLAEKNNWAGVVVNGCIRDSLEIDACEIGVRALATMPRRAAKKGVGERNIAIKIADIGIAPGNWVYADADGVLISDAALHEKA